MGGVRYKVAGIWYGQELAGKDYGAGKDAAGTFFWRKSTANCVTHLTESIFQTCARKRKRAVDDGARKAVIRAKTEADGRRACVPETDTLVTVITVCRNSRDVIGKTMDSVLNQTADCFEYLVVDGASADGTVDVAKAYKGLFQARGIKYTVCSEPDQGIYDAMNKGIQLACGKIIGFINAGDWYEKDAVEAVAKEYVRRPFDYFYADVRLVHADGHVAVKHSRAGYFPTSRHWNHPASFVYKGLYQELGGFLCEGIHDDFEFFLRVKKARKNIRVVNRVLANFSMGGISNKKDVTMCFRRIRDRYRAYKRNGYSPFYLLECIAMEAAKLLLG